MGFSKNLCDLMQKKGVSSYKLAKDIGVHISTVSNWRDGKMPLIEHLKRTAEYFNVSVDDLISQGESFEADSFPSRTKSE